MCGGVGEVRAELEVDGASIIHSSQSASVLREERAHGGEASSLGGGESCAGAEERSFACRSEQIRAFVVECGYRAQRQFACVVAFQCIDACRGRFLLRSCAGGVVLSECGQACRPGEWLVVECVMAEGIADVDVVVQVRERRDLSCVGRVVVDDDGEPEPEFAEPDGHRCDVDAEDGCREDVASDRGGRAWIAELLAECREAFEGGDEESTGAAGRVEHTEGGKSVEDRRGVVWCHESSRQRIAECFVKGVVECVAECVVVGVDRVCQCVVDQRGDQCCRRVERARAATLVGVHERFERAAQEVGVDGGFGP